MSREEALDLLKKHITNRKILSHCLAVEVIMRGLAKHLREDEAVWGTVGLLHDLDYDKTKSNPEEHTLITAKMLENQVSNEIIRAIKAHNAKYTKVSPQTAMDKALIAADAVSGLLIACALVMPSKRLEEVSIKTVKKKFKSKDFAKNVNRERILVCQEMGIPIEGFFEISLKSLQSISQELGL